MYAITKSIVQNTTKKYSRTIYIYIHINSKHPRQDSHEMRSEISYMYEGFRIIQLNRNI
jgi:hypothetical protein